MLRLSKTKSQPAPRGPFAWATTACISGLFCLVAPGCKDLSVASANLDALLDENNNLRHVANVRSGIAYYLDSLIDPRWFGGKSMFWQDQQAEVLDPAQTALRNLLTLSEGKGARAEHRNIIQVRQFSRYALRSPGKLVRERAVLELKPHALRLGITDFQSVLESGEQPTEFWNATDLSTVLAGLIETLEPVIQSGSSATKTQRNDLALACAQVDTKRLDIDGLWRMLKAIETFAARASLASEQLSPLAELSKNLQARAVALALLGAHRDSDPRVQSASVAVCHAAFGPPYLAEALRWLRNPGPTEPDKRFALDSAPLLDGAVLRVLFAKLRSEGWPNPAPTTLQERTQRFADLRSLLTIVNETAVFDSQTRTQAMLALGTLVPDGPGSIRDEDWVAWWQTWSASEMQALDSMRTGQGASTTP